jgi:hypothetical protein
VIEQSKFAARELIARLERDVGAKLPELLVEKMLFAFEMGYLRGRTDASQEMIATMAEVTRTQEAAHAILETLAVIPKDP